MVKNVNRVPKKKWSRWSKEAKVIFNRCYDFLMSNQVSVNHPKAPKLPFDQWKTVAWNAAWIAADACDDTVPAGVVDA